MYISHELLQSTLDIAYQAGEHLKDFYKTPVKISKKPDNKPETYADLLDSNF